MSTTTLDANVQTATPAMAAPRRRLVLAVVLLAAFVINLDSTIVNVALPALSRELHASTTDLQRIVDAYPVS